MADSQLQTYRYNQLAEQALALRKLCETGFGPADLCARTAQAAGPGAGERAAEELPAVAEIDGARGTLSAVLVMADGRRLAVRPGSVLPGGLTVVAITGDEVRAATPAGRAERLPFADRERRR
jgi:type IV pilus biogenesis protein PilP